MTRTIDSAAIADIRARTQKLTPELRPLWGTMSPNEMICHLSDALRHPLGDRPAMLPPPSWFRHVVLKHFVLRMIPRYPKGAQTRAAFDPKRDGTKPGEFARDLAELDSLTTRFVQAAPKLTVQHTRFGRMTEWEWLRWWWMHTDHHLRQFGV